MAWNEGLLPAQEAAASHVGTHARLLAGPGTGKTHVMTRRVVFLLTEQRIPPDEVLALTFTRAAASELHERVAEELREEWGDLDEEEDLPRISTLHSFALRQLLRNAPRLGHLPQPLRIADDWEERHIIQEDIKELVDDEDIDIRDVQQLFRQLAADWQTLSAEDENFTPDASFIGAWREHRDLYGYTLRSELVYQLKRALGQIPDLDLETPIRHLLVDEYQDLNRCDLALVREIAERGAEVFIAGDDDQSIYGFREANPEGIRQFPNEYDPATNLRLEVCLRCDEEILDFAQFVAELDVRRVPKALRAYEGRVGGDVSLLQFENQYGEAAGVARLCRNLIDDGHEEDEILILLRSDKHDAFSGPLVDQLREHDVAVTAGTSEGPLDEEGGELVMAFLRLLADSNDHLAWRTIVQERNNGLGPGARAAIHEQCRARGERFADALHRIAETPEQLDRFGRHVQQEVGAVQATLGQVRDELDPQGSDPEELVATVSALGQAVLDDEVFRDRVVGHLASVVQQAQASSVTDTLRALAVQDAEMEQPLESGHVNILTMHQAKGLSADTVIVAGAEDERIPGRNTAEPDLGDERRLLFVSLSRARHRLFVTYCNERVRRQQNFGRERATPDRTLTRFLQDAPIHPLDGTRFTYRYVPDLEDDAA